MNLYTEEKKQKRPISTAAVVRIVIWSVVLAILCGVFSLCMAGEVFGRGGISALNFGGYRYDHPDSYTVGNGVSSESISEIDIEWLNGNIDLVPSDGTDIVVSEDYAGDDDNLRIRWKIENGKLIIKYRASDRLFGSKGNLSKKLTVSVPRAMLDAMRKVDIDTVNSNIVFSGNATKMSLELVDGSVTANGHIDDLNLDGTNLRMTLIGSIKSLDVDGVDVTLDMHLTAGKEMDIDGVDTTVHLYLSDAITGFAVEKDSLGGSTTVNGYEGVTRRGDYGDYWGDGSLRIDLDGVDSKLTIEKETKD